MSRYRFGHAKRRAAARIATLAAMLALAAPSAQAGEVVTRDCLHGANEAYSFGYRSGYGDAYSSDYGDQSSTGYSYTRPDDGGLRPAFTGGFRRGFAGHFHRGFVDRATDDNGGGAVSTADAGATTGYRNGYADTYGSGARSNYGADSCVEIHHELINPYVIQVPPPRSEAEAREAENRERLWRARCHPVIRQDRYGVNRYVYAAPGCDFGRYE